MPAIDDLTAAQLSAASYTPIGYYRTGLLPETTYLGINDVDKRSLPPGWKVDSLRSVYTGNSDNPRNQMLVMVNETTKQVVLSFKGSDNIPNFQSDLGDFGAKAYGEIAPGIEVGFPELRSHYRDYYIATDGHSLGMGMAQIFSLKHMLDGYGQNGLPIPPDVIRQEWSTDYEVQLNNYRANHTFSSVSIMGEPATNYYFVLPAQDGLAPQYLNIHPRSIPNPWADYQQISIEMSQSMNPIAKWAGGFMSSYLLAKMHGIWTVADVLKNSPATNPPTETKPLAADASIWTPVYHNGNIFGFYDPYGYSFSVGSEVKNGGDYSLNLTSVDFNYFSSITGSFDYSLPGQTEVNSNPNFYDPALNKLISIEHFLNANGTPQFSVKLTQEDGNTSSVVAVTGTPTNIDITQTMSMLGSASWDRSEITYDNSHHVTQTHTTDSNGTSSHTVYDPNHNGRVVTQKTTQADGSSVESFYSQDEVNAEVVQRTTATNGSRTIIYGGRSINFAGAVREAVAIDQYNRVQVALGNSGSTITIGSNGALTFGNDINFSDAFDITNVDVDEQSNIQFTANLGAAGMAKLVASGGQSGYRLELNGKTYLDFSSGGLAFVTKSPDGSVNFGMQANGDVFSWNPETGSVSFKNGARASTTIGQVGDGQRLVVNGDTGFSFVTPDGRTSQTVQVIGGNLLQKIENFADGGSQITIVDAANQTTEINIFSGADGNGANVFHATPLNEGGYVFTRTTNDADPNKRKLLYEGIVDKNGILIAENFYDRSMTVEQFTDIVVANVATHFIQKALHGNVPASMAAQALLTTTLDTSLGIRPPSSHNIGQTKLTGAELFGARMANAFVVLGGGVAGSQLGSYIDKQIDLPIPVATITLGAAGSAAIQSIASDVAMEVFHVTSGFGVRTTTEAGRAITDSTKFVESFKSGFVASLGTWTGSQMASMIVPLSADAKTGSSIGASVTTAILSSYWDLGISQVFALATGTNFISDLIAGLIEALGYRGRPYANADLGFRDGQLTIMAYGQDNNGNTDFALSLGNAAVNKTNAILRTIGGRANSSTIWEVGHLKDQATSFLQNDWPPTVDKQYSDPNMAVDDAVFHVLRNTIISGGNPYMVYALLHSDVRNLTDLLFDLSAAKDFSIYITNPMAFNTALALSNDSQKLAQWMAEYNRAITLGLDKIAGTATTFVGSDNNDNFDISNGDSIYGRWIDGGGGHNVLIANNFDLSSLEITNIAELSAIGTVRLSSAQLMQLSTLVTTSGPATLEASHEGLFDVAAKVATGTINVRGSNGNDTLRGKNNILEGNGGNDTYQFNAGDGQVVIKNGTSASSASKGSLAITGHNAREMLFQQSGNDLVIKFINSTDQVTVNDWFANEYSKLQSITASGGSFSAAMIASLIGKNAIITDYSNNALNPADAIIIATKKNFLGTNETDKFIRTAAGELGVITTDENGVVTGHLWFTQNGSSVIVGPGTTIVGMGQNAFGNGHDIFVWEGGNYLQTKVLEVTDSGETNVVAPTINGVPALPHDPSVTIIGVTQNIFDPGLEFYYRDGVGKLTILHVYSNGDTRIITPTYQRIQNVVWDPDTTIVGGWGGGSGNLGGSASHYIALRDGKGFLQIWNIRDADYLRALNNGDSGDTWRIYTPTINGVRPVIALGSYVMGGGISDHGDAVYWHHMTDKIEKWDLREPGEVVSTVDEMDTSAPHNGGFCYLGVTYNNGLIPSLSNGGNIIRPGILFEMAKTITINPGGRFDRYAQYIVINGSNGTRVPVSEQLRPSHIYMTNGKDDDAYIHYLPPTTPEALESFKAAHPNYIFGPK